MNSEIEKEVFKCVQTLKDGGYIVFPSEIGWSIACDATDEKLVISLMNAEEYDFHAVLLDSPGRLSKYVNNIVDATWDLIEFSEKPLHLIMEETINYPCESFRDAEMIAFRIVKDEFTKAVTGKFGKPVFAAALKTPGHPVKTSMILNRTCYVVNLRAGSKSTTDNLVVMRFLKEGKFELIRK